MAGKEFLFLSEGEEKRGSQYQERRREEANQFSEKVPSL
jgi:hypothetical protein